MHTCKSVVSEDCKTGCMNNLLLRVMRVRCFNRYCQNGVGFVNTELALIMEGFVNLEEKINGS